VLSLHHFKYDRLHVFTVYFETSGLYSPATDYTLYFANRGLDSVSSLQCVYQKFINYILYGQKTLVSY